MMKKIAILIAALMVCVLFAGSAFGGNPLDENDGFDDPDKDGLFTWEEQVLGTDPYNSDSDNDGLPDGWEYMYTLDPSDAADAHQDADGEDDGLITGEKRAQFSEVRKIIDVWPCDGYTGVVDLVFDEDEQHYDNYEEYYRAYYDLAPPHGILYMHTNPINPDTDSDGILDPDDKEPLGCGSDGTSPGGEGDDSPNDSPEGDDDEPNPDIPPDDDDSPTDPDKPGPPGPPTPTTDSDGDLVPDLEEPDLLTDPNDWDTDNDHMADGNEPGSGIGTNALAIDSDNDGI